MTRHLPFIPYPPIGKHGVTGDRRTAALIAADGTVDWMCVPDYDGKTIFGALLDAEQGGYWRLGPKVAFSGEQTYRDHSSAVKTSWETDTGRAELLDVMIWPEEQRDANRASRRVLLRCLRCTYGTMTCRMDMHPRLDFQSIGTPQHSDDGLTFGDKDDTFGLWTSFPVTCEGERVIAEFTLNACEEVWAAFGYREDPQIWSQEAARQAFEETNAFWEEWLGALTYEGLRSQRIEHSALIIHLLGYAPDGAMVAAPTTSLPERIAGSRNYDYRYAWVRDASLSVSGLTLLGDKPTAMRYLDWMAGAKTSIDAPLQVAYHPNGDTNVQQHERKDINGYRGSRPVLFGNRAFNQVQHGSLGYLIECAHIYLDAGGEWREEYWRLVERVVQYTMTHWQDPDSGIWELPKKEHYVNSKVMCWVVMDRGVKIAKLTGHKDVIEKWSKVRDAIHADVMEHGWSERRQSFVQRYGSDALDASALLIPLMDFLPPDHPRVIKTIERIVEALTIDGLVYRFDPADAPVENPEPIGQFEGSFLPCTFWLASAYARGGRTREAEMVLQRTESLTQGVALFAEEADARSNELLGNYPLLFSQVEYIRAVLTLNEARRRWSGWTTHSDE